MLKTILNNPIISILVGVSCALIINILKGIIKAAIKGNFSWKELIKGSSFKLLSLVLCLFTCTYVWGYYKGQLSRPADFKVNYQDEIYFYIPKSAVGFWKPKQESKAYWIYSDGRKEVVKQGDIKELTIKLKPYGFMLEPVLILGYGASNVDSSVEVGAGLRYARFKKWIADICITNKGAYPIGVSYKITDNSAVGLSVGTGYKEGERGIFERFLLKYSVKF